MINCELGGVIHELVVSKMPDSLRLYFSDTKNSNRHKKDFINNFVKVEGCAKLTNTKCVYLINDFYVGQTINLRSRFWF